MRKDWSNNDVERSQGFTHKCWLNSAHTSTFPQVQSSLFTELQHEFNRELDNTDKAFKHDRTTTVIKIDRAENSYVLKRYNARSFWHRLKRALRISRAERCWCMSYHFQRAGLNVAEPVMMLECRVGPFRQDAYLVCEMLQGRELLTLLPGMDAQEQQMVRAAVSDAYDAMYQHRITHGDMKASNLLWVDQKLFFIDLDAATHHRSRASWRHSHAKDRKRFLKNWRDKPDLLGLFES